MLFVIVLLNCLFANDIIKYPELLPIKNQEILEHIKQKDQPQFLDDNYWDDDRILFSTYFGGSGYDCINDGAFDSQGNFIQVGYTGSPDLPIVGDAFQKEKNLNHDMFIVKWNPAGDVIWSTFLGGSGSDVLYSVAIDKNDDIIVAGRTESPDIIVSEDASQKDYKGESDFYIAKFTKDGGYVWSTYLGGSKQEYGTKIVLDDAENIYLGGTTGSTGKNGKPNVILPTRENAIMRDINKVFQDGEVVSIYLSKFTPEGKYIWGTYFGNNGDASEVLTGLDVYKDEIAFSWDLWGYRVTEFGTHLFTKVTADAEQKQGVVKSGSLTADGWQTQVFKIDTAGTTLKYGTFYCGDNSLSRKVKYDKDGNLILHVATLREIPKKDSVFKSSGHLVFVKYNRENKLEWDFGFGCFDLDKGSICYDFDIDENNVLWTAGSTSCDELEQGINPFPSIDGPGVRPTGCIIVIDLENYKHWASYYDIGGRERYDVSVKNNILNVSGETSTIRAKPGGLYYDQTAFGFFISFNMKDVFNYKDSTDSIDTIDTLSPEDEILFYPNPVNDYIYLKNLDTVKSIRILDLIGKEYLNIQEIKNTEINLSRLSIGVYFIIINEKNVFKIIKR